MKKRACYCLWIFPLLFVSFSGTTQQNNYTQWNHTSLLINPAFNGFYNNNMRFSSIYRGVNDQGIPGQQSFQFNFEAKPFQSLLVNDLDEWSIGITANRFSAVKTMFSHSMFALTTAYSKSLNENGTHSLALGFQAAMHSQKVNLNNLDFTSQFSVRGFDRMLPNFEASQNYNNNYLDLNAGILYSFGNEYETFFAGLGAHQLNRVRRELSVDPKFNPVLDLSLGYTRYINDRYVFNAAGNFNFNYPVNNQVIMLGFGTTISELSDDLLTAGLYYRFDAIASPFLQFQTNGMKMTFSYDTYASPKISGVGDRRALELSLAFRFSSKDYSVRYAKLDCFK